ncbi:MAG: hypothetical protein EPO22_05110 [Dehalococcoidia bacterium]|nr:MAG: hypothetical protein EPO22_05110 [Dehalococcoidia bacterium]
MIVALAMACGGSKPPLEATRQAGYDKLAGARPVEVRQTPSGCEPVSIKVKPGEMIQLRITNQTDVEYRLAVLDAGQPYNDLIVPPGEMKSTYYSVPPSGPVLNMLCYVQGGVSTTIDVLTE